MKLEVSPPHREQRPSSPPFDDFSDLGSDDFKALDAIEAKLSQKAHEFIRTDNDEIMKLGGIESDANEYEPDSMLIGMNHEEPDVLRSRGLLQISDVSSAAPHFTNLSSPRNVSPIVQSTGIPPSSAVSNDDQCFTRFTSASTFQPGIVESTPIFRQASAKSRFLPSAVALETAVKRQKVWDAEIESELATLDHRASLVGNNPLDNGRIPFQAVDNSARPSSLATQSAVRPDDTNNDTQSRRPFKRPRTMTPLRNQTPISPSDEHTSTKTIYPRRNSRDPIRDSLFRKTSTPSTPLPPPKSRPLIQLQSIAKVNGATTPERSFSSQLLDTMHKPKPLGLTPRAYAFTGSSKRFGFVPPFKQGMDSEDGFNGDISCEIQPDSQTGQKFDSKGNFKELLLPRKLYDKNDPGNNNNLAKSSHRRTLSDCGLVPRTFSVEEFNRIGFGTKISSLTSVSHLLYYRFDPIDPKDPGDPLVPTGTSMGSDTALSALLANGCHRATKAWVDNHWPLILWKLIGMSCLDTSTLAVKWSWTEVMRQLGYRYTREMINGKRPALRLIATRDAPASAPIILCVSEIFWTDEYVTSDGQLVPSSPELVLTDGWYRLRATVDEALARATRNRILRVGRKIACCGSRLESSKKDPVEILDAYENVHLVLSGNSTHLAQWHAKLGFQSTYFFSTLRSLSPDGGNIPLMDLIVVQVFPVAYVEYTTTESGEKVRQGTRTEREELEEEDKWKGRREQEALKIRDRLEKKISRLQSYADRLDRIAGSSLQHTREGSESPPHGIKDYVDELDESEDPELLIKSLSKTDAKWVSESLRKKCEADMEKCGNFIDQEVTASFPPRDVRSFQILRVQDARTGRKPSTRTAQLTVWDVTSLHIADGSMTELFVAGKHYLVTNLTASQQSAWMGLTPGSEVFLSTRRDSKWKIIN